MKRAAVFCLILASCAFAAATNKPKVRSGIYRGRKVTYMVANGKNIFEGDIILERVDHPDPSRPVGDGIGIVYPSNLWPKVGSVYQIPYTITSGGQNVTNSITAFNNTFAGFMEWVARTNETDYVDFNLDPNDHSGVCNSSVGRVG